MINTLDNIETKNNQKTFSTLSFISSLITVGIVTYLISIIPRVLNVSIYKNGKLIMINNNNTVQNSAFLN